MSSIMTNTSAMTALQALQTTNRNIEETQNRISTGYRISEAADNAAYWSIATTMRSDNKVLSTVQDALGLGAGLVDTAYTATNTVIEYVDEIKSKIAAATQSGLDKSKIQSEIIQLIDGIRSTATSASYAGSNWLVTETGAAATQEIVSSFTRDATGAISLGTITITLADYALIDITTATGTSQVGLLENVTFSYTPATATSSTSVTGFDLTALDVTTADLERALVGVDHILGQLTKRASDLGAIKKRIDLQTSFVDNLMDAMERGIGQLVDADMEEESTRLQALQVQQQLGIQALSIANSNAQMILQLFQN
ncbi:flagellin [Oricola thermophila]|uniref:Flagellin n=1 Tax=Oricola thermophila TaxID=2742145 RepID=A0A6N1VFL0_9HYPH|nr:flagellin [Oricola thermophila]QKV19634.1 flagellin [Oricola thermophila]